MCDLLIKVFLFVDFSERNVLGLSCSVTMNDSSSKSISFFKDCVSESLDLPGSISDTKEEFNSDSKCAVKNINIDEQSDQSKFTLQYE